MDQICGSSAHLFRDGQSFFQGEVGHVSFLAQGIQHQHIHTLQSLPGQIVEGVGIRDVGQPTHPKAQNGHLAVHHRQRPPGHLLDVEGVGPNGSQVYGRHPWIFVLGKNVMKFPAQRRLHSWRGIHRHVPLKSKIEGPNVVHARHMVLVLMGIDHAIKVVHLLPKHLLAKVGACIHHNPHSLGLDEDARSQPIVPDILRSAHLTRAPNHGNPLRGARAKECQLYMHGAKLQPLRFVPLRQTPQVLDSNRVILSAKQKALRINLNQDLYGTFAEIGAGQEVVRHFFRAGGASGTIAKTISAYDKDFSDAIYGQEAKGRYVCESRLVKMLDYEYNLIEDRLSRAQHPTKHFFAFANTVATINYHKTIQGHGWFGLKFQSSPEAPANTVLLHARLHEQDALLQQQTTGILGVNLIYGCLFFHKRPKDLLKSLYDDLDRDQVEIDMIQMNGPDFSDVDNRLLSLQLVKNGMTDAVIFSPDGRNLQAADVLYKKNILAIRGSFRPVTKVNIDMIAKGLRRFKQEAKVDQRNLQVLFEITLNNLSAEGDIDEKDFLDRADVLCSIGQTVLISNYQKYYKLVEFFSRYTKKRMGLILGANTMAEVFNEKYYRDLNGGILEAFGILFSRDLKIYLYPWLDEKSKELWTTETTPIHPRLKPLFDYLLFNKRISDIEDYDEEILSIFSKEALQRIKSGDEGWEHMVPDFVDRVIKEKCLFGYCGALPNSDERSLEDAALAAARAINPPTGN